MRKKLITTVIAPPKDDRQPTSSPIIRKCAIESCGKEFTYNPRSRARKYCSARCSYIAWSKQLGASKVAEPKDTKICEACRKEYTPLRTDQKYCGNPECRLVGREKSAERQAQRRTATKLK